MIAKNKGRIPRVVIMLGIVSLFTDVASEMIFPLLPVYIAALGSGAVLLGIIEGVAESTSAMLKLVFGILSDRIGKKKLLVLIGYSISSLVRPLTGIVSSSWQIIAIRMFDRVGKGIRTSPRDALVASAVDVQSRGRAFGFERAMDHTGAVIGPILAIITLLILFVGFGFKSPISALRWTFLLALIPGLLAIITIIVFVKETTPAKNKSNTFKFSLENFAPDFKNYLLIMILFTLGNSSDAFLLFRVEESIQNSGSVVEFVRSIGALKDLVSHFGNEKEQANIINILFLPFIWAFFHIIKVIFSTPLGGLSDRIGRKKVINIGWGIYSFIYFSFALLVFLPSDYQIIVTFLLFALYAFFYAFTEGAEKAFVADLVNDDQRGSAYGLFNFSIGLGALPASIIFGFLYSSFDKEFPGFGGTVAFGFGALIAFISMILLATKVKEPSKII